MNDQVTISVPPKTEYLKAAAAMLNAMVDANIADLPGVTVMKAVGDVVVGADTTGTQAPPPPGATDIPAADAPPPPTTDTAQAAELDKEGIPWDSRIHGKAQNKNKKDGTWRLIKGVDKELVATVKAELLAATPATTDTPAADTTAPPAPTGDVTFGDLISKVTKYTAKGRLSPAIVNQILSTHGLTTIAELMQKPELIATVASEIDTLCQQS